MASDVANTRKQVVRTLDPVSNLVFDVSFRRLRVAKNRAATLGSAPSLTQPDANGTQTSSANPSTLRFPFFKWRAVSRSTESRAPQPGSNTGTEAKSNAPSQRFAFLNRLRRDGNAGADQPESQETETTASGALVSLLSFKRRGAAGAPSTRGGSAGESENSNPNANSVLRRLKFFNRRAAMSSNSEEGEPKPGSAPEGEVPEAGDSTTADKPADSKRDSGLAGHRTSLLAVDEAGRIQRLDSPCPQQEFFSVSLSISWQRKIPSRLQVHHEQEQLGVDSRRPSTHSDHPVSRKSDGAEAELGSVIFTAAADDIFSLEYERNRRICTSKHEKRLVNMADAQNSDSHDTAHRVPAEPHISTVTPTSSIMQRASSQQYQVFFILADLSWEDEDPSADPEHRLLLCAQAFKDGTIQLQPPVDTKARHQQQPGNRGGWRKLHDRQGGLYEYKISVRATGGSDDSISERKQQLWEEHERQHAARAHRGMLGKFFRPRGSRLAVFGEILSAGAFESPRLYVEFALRYRPDLWILKGPDWLLEQHAALDGHFDEEGICHVAGCTQLCHGKWVPGRFIDHIAGAFVSNFCHPLEFQLELREHKRLPAELQPTEFPTLFFEVHSIDGMLRSSPQGYCMLPLAPHCPGSATHRLQAWRPALTAQQRIAEFYLGGAPELQSVGFVGYPTDAPTNYVAGRTPLVKLATPNEATGWLRVRTHCALQYSDPDMHPQRRGMLTLGQPGMPAPKQAHRSKLETVEQIVQHATEYIQHVTEHDPKGDELHRTAIARHTARLRQRHSVPDGAELTVLPAAIEAVSRTRVFRPRIVVQPADVQAEIGSVAEVQLSVQAQGEGLKYQWHKDGEVLANDTAAAAALILSSPCVEDCGFYHVVVSNAAGSVQSTRVHVIIKPEAARPPQPTPVAVDSPGRAGRAAARRRKMLESQAPEAASTVDASPAKAEEIQPAASSAPAPVPRADAATAEIQRAQDPNADAN